MIVGGESGGRAAVRRGLDPVGGRAVPLGWRAGDREAARRAASVPLHTIEDHHLRMTKRDGRWHLVDMRPQGSDPSEWPDDLRVQELPDDHPLILIARVLLSPPSAPT